jgi:hypothetical protein
VGFPSVAGLALQLQTTVLCKRHATVNNREP